MKNQKPAASALLLLTALTLTSTQVRAKDYAEALKQASQESYCVAPEQVPSPRGGVAFVGLTIKAPLPKDGGKPSKKRQSLEALIELKKAVRGACDAEVQ